MNSQVGLNLDHPIYPTSKALNEPSTEMKLYHAVENDTVDDSEISQPPFGCIKPV